MQSPHSRREPASHARSFLAHAGIWAEQEELLFLIPDLDRDYPKGVYLTMALARASVRPEVHAWFSDARYYWTLVKRELTGALGGDQLAFRRLRVLLSIPEQAEVRLGYVREGHDGSGPGDGELLDLLMALLGSWGEFRDALPTEPDVLSMAPGFGMDRTSDVAVALGKRHLITFTQWCAQFYQFDQRIIASCDVPNVWNAATGTFEILHGVRLPVDADSRPIILVPTEVVRSDTPLDVARYFREIYGDEYAGSTSKRQLLEDATLHPGRLAEYARDRLKDPSKYRPRRDLFPRPARDRRKRK